MTIQDDGVLEVMETGEEKEDLASIISSAWDEVETKEASPETDTKTEPATVSAKKESTSGVETPTTEAMAGSPVEVEEISPPISWKEKEKEAFRKLPKELQETISRRESERDKGTQKAFEEAARYRREREELEEIFEPYDQELKLAGATRAQVIRQALAVQEQINRDPKGSILKILDAYGLSLPELAESHQPVDPHVQALQQEISRLQQYVSGQQVAAQTEYVGHVESEIETFASEVDESGSARFPHFNDVYYDMLPIVKAMRESNPQATHRQILEAAYDRAVYASPAVRERMIESRLKQAEAKRIEDQKAQAQKARSAAVSIKGSPNASAAPVGPEDLRKTLEMAWDGQL